MATVPTPKTWTTPEVTAADLNAQIRDAMAFLLNPPRCLVKRRDTNQSVPDGTSTNIEFQSAETEWDNDSMVDLATNDDRVTITTAGIYKIDAAIQVAATVASGRQEILIRHYNSSGVEQGYMRKAIRANTYGWQGMHATFVMELAAADYISLQLFQNSGSAQNIADASLAVTWISSDETYGDTADDRPTVRSPFLPGDVANADYWNQRIGRAVSWAVVPPMYLHYCEQYEDTPASAPDISNNSLTTVPHYASSPFTDDMLIEKRGDWGTTDLTIPEDGIYEVVAHVEIDAYTGSATQFEFLLGVWMTRGTATGHAISETLESGQTTNDCGATLSFLYPLKADDVLQVECRHQYGSTLDLQRVGIWIRKVSD